MLNKIKNGYKGWNLIDGKLSDQVFIDLQNRFRGLVSDFKSKGFVKDRVTSPTRRFRSGLCQLLLVARAVLHPSQFDLFVNWTTQQIDAQIPDSRKISIGYEELSGIFTQAPTVSLEREFFWITARIKAEAKKLNSFRMAVDSVERLVFSNSFDEAIAALEAVQRVFGATLWGVQLRIALEQQAGGLERQKRYTAEVRAVYKRGLLGFLAYHTSVLNEDKTTLAKFLDDIKGRINKHQYYEPFVKTYVRYRLACEWPTSEVGLAEILRVEQSHSLIDVYETFVAVVQEVVRRDDLLEARNVLVKCLGTLTDIDDFRLIKAKKLLTRSNSLSEQNTRSTEISDPMFSGNIKLAAKATRRMQRTPEGLDPWQIIYAGFCLSHFRRRNEDLLLQPKNIARLIGNIQSRLNTADESFAQLGKLVINIRGLPTAVGLHEMLQQFRRTRPNDPWRPWLIGMNSRTNGIEDIAPNTFTKIDFAIVKKLGSTNVAWSGFHGNDNGLFFPNNAGAAMLTAAGLVNKRENLTAVKMLTPISFDPGPKPLQTIAVLLLLHAYFNLGDRQNLITLVANEGSRSEANRQLLPVAPTLEHFLWADYKAVPQPLSAPIALHLLWTQTESDTTASLLRFATGTFLRSSGVERPSKLFDYADQYSKHELIYFLKIICTSQILDVSRVVKNTREVMEERQAICASLRLLDPENSSDYEDEIITISNQLALDDGQYIVDRTRIHVDTDALSRWAVKELSEDYARYSDLLTVDVGAIQNFDDVLKELANPLSTQYSTFTPEDEADAVLTSILRRLGEEFMNNPSFGLDFYLSQRIRHQSFIGLIRGPLEFASLITTRESESGRYRRNDFWLDRFRCASPEAMNSLEEAFAKCAANFDDTLIAAKDKSFHVHSLEKPTGLLFLNFTPQLVAVARAVVRLDANLADFINTSVALLWATLEASLSQVRIFISDELKTKIADGFDELRANVRSLAEQDPAFLEFDIEVGLRSTEVQRALDDAAMWFTRADIEAHKRLFTLKQVVKIATDSALKSQRAFDPNIHSIVENDLQMTASSLVFVHDVLFVALDNVRAHSGVKKPKVQVRVQPNFDESTLTIEVTSDTKSHTSSLKEKELRDIRQLIEAGGGGRRTRREGGSGFAKLAAVVSQSSKGKIDFGFIDHNQFQLTVTYSLVLQPLDQYKEDHG